MFGEMAEKILKAVDSLMVQGGYSAFSYADISEAVGIKKASIHHHFPTEAGLVVAVLRAHHERVIQGTAMLDTKIESPLARLQAYIQHWEGRFRGKTASFCVAALLGAEAPSLPGEVQAEVRLYFAELGDWLERTLKDGVKKQVIRLQSTEATEAQTLMAVVHGGMLSARAMENYDVFKIVTAAALKRISAVKH